MDIVDMEITRGLTDLLTLKDPILRDVVVTVPTSVKGLDNPVFEARLSYSRMRDGEGSAHLYMRTSDTHQSGVKLNGVLYNFGVTYVADVPDSMLNNLLDLGWTPQGTFWRAFHISRKESVFIDATPAARRKAEDVIKELVAEFLSTEVYVEALRQAILASMEHSVRDAKQRAAVSLAKLKSTKETSQNITRALKNPEVGGKK